MTLKTNSYFLAPINLKISDYKSSINFDDFILRTITSEELNEYWGIELIEHTKWGTWESVVYLENRESYYPLRNMAGAECPYCIEFKETADTIKVENFLLAIRMFKFGKVEVPYIFDASCTRFRHIRTPHVRLHELVNLSTNDFIYINDLYKKVNCLHNEKFNLIAERYESAISCHSSIKNAFVDLVGILESITLGNQKDELRFRFSLLVTHLFNEIGINISFKDVREIYDIRSRLVHSGYSKEFNVDFYWKVLDYTRLAIKWYFEIEFNSEKAFMDVINKLGLEY